MYTFNNCNKQIFKDEKLQQELDREGYVIIQFYSQEEVKELTDYYYTNTPFKKKGFLPNSSSYDDSYRIRTNNKILDTAKKHIENYFVNYKSYMGGYIVKNSDRRSELGIHQDMTLVDESNFVGLNIWSPLCDTNNINGALHVLPQSHRIFPTYRSATIPAICDKYYSLIKRYMKPIYIKAGEAIVFEHGLLHYSPVNTSGKIRISTNIFITHKDAKITICYYDKDTNKIELIEQSDDFFNTFQQFNDNYNKKRQITGKSIGFRDYNFPVLTPEILKEKYGDAPNESWLHKTIRELIFR